MNKADQAAILMATRAFVMEEMAKVPAGPKGEDGRKGDEGKDGRDGRDGRDGAFITDAYLTKEGKLAVDLSTGDTLITKAEVRGEQGPSGIQGERGLRGTSVKGFNLSTAGDLSVSLETEYEDATGEEWSVDLGNIKGPQGEKGDQGDGVAETKVDNGILLCRVKDRWLEAGPVVGPRGRDGKQGQRGREGKQGIQGTGFTWRGQWSNGTEYRPNDLVESEGNSYICIKASKGRKPRAGGSNWDLFASRGMDGPDLGPQVSMELEKIKQLAQHRGGGGGGSITVYDEGVQQATATEFDFVGAGVNASVSGGRATVTVSSSAENAFNVIAVPSGSNPVADTTTDTLTLDTSNNRLSITGDASTDTVTFTVNEGNIDHDALAGYVANQHIDWTAASDDFNTTGTATNAGQTVNGNIIVTGTVDGRDVSVDGAKLDTLVAPLPYTTATDPAQDAAVTQAIVDANSGVFVTTTGASNDQTIAAPTDTTAGKSFIVGVTDTSTVPVYFNGVLVQQSEAYRFIWDGNSWALEDLAKTANDRGLSTAFITRPQLSINADPTLFDWAPFIGLFIDRTTTVDKPVLRVVSLAGATGVVNPLLALAPFSGVSIDHTGTLSYAVTSPSEAQKRGQIYMGTLIHQNFASYNGINNFTVVSNNDLGARFSDFGDVIGTINTKQAPVRVSANGANLFLNLSAGRGFNAGFYDLDRPDDPHGLPVAAKTGGAVPGVNTTWIDSFYYDNGGGDTGYVITPGKVSIVPGAYDDGTAVSTDTDPQGSVNANRYTLKHVYCDPGTETIVVVAGQNEYGTLAEAQANAENDLNNFGISPALEDFVIINRIICRGNTVALNDTANNLFLDTAFISGIGGNSAQGGLSTLQNTVDNSAGSTPKVQMQAGTSPVSWRAYSGGDAVDIITFEQFDGTQTLGLRGNGDISMNAAAHTIGVGLGANTLTLGEATSTVTTAGNHTVGGNVTITGDLTVNGTTITANTETVLIEDNMGVINNGETGAGVTAGIAGWEIHRGTETNYRFIFDEADDSFKIGEIGSLQKAATREDAPTDNGVSFWNNGASQLQTSTNLEFDGTTFTVGATALFENGAGVETGRLFNDAGVLHLRASTNVTGLALGAGGAERARLTSAGNLLIGTTTDNGQRLQVVGDAVINGALTADIRPASGSYASAGAQLFTTATNGLFLSGQTGSSTDFLFTNGIGQTVFSNPTGTRDLAFLGNISQSTGQFLANRNTTALPGIAFSDDPDTGFRGAGSNILQAVTGGIARQVWDPINGTELLGDFQVSGRLTGAFGADSTSGVLDWDDISNSRPGSGATLLTNTAANKPPADNFFHPFNFEYSSKDGTGNITQLAIPYGQPESIDAGIYMRGRFSGTWSDWVKVITEERSGVTPFTGALKVNTTSYLAPTQNGEGTITSSSVNGLMLSGQGTVNDVAILNSGGEGVMIVPTGTRNATFAGTISSTVDGSASAPVFRKSGTGSGIYFNGNDVNIASGSTTPMSIGTGGVDIGISGVDPLIVRRDIDVQTVGAAGFFERKQCLVGTTPTTSVEFTYNLLDADRGNFGIRTRSGGVMSEALTIDSSRNTEIKGELSLRSSSPLFKLGSSSGNDPRIDFLDQSAETTAASIFFDQSADELKILRTASGGATDGISIKASGVMNVGTAPTFADDAAAGVGGLVAGDVYKTTTGELRIKV